MSDEQPLGVTSCVYAGPPIQLSEADALVALQALRELAYDREVELETSWKRKARPAWAVGMQEEIAEMTRAADALESQLRTGARATDILSKIPRKSPY